MKRAEQLQKLSREHHVTLVMAKKIAKTAKSGTEDELQDAIKLITEHYDDELEQHFQHEEHTIYKLIFSQYKEYVEVSKPLLKDHGFVRMIIPRLNLETAREDLFNLAEVLIAHTRVEERTIFPIIEELFTDEQLEAILNFVPLD